MVCYAVYVLSMITMLCVFDIGEDPFIWYDSRYDVIHSLWHYTCYGDCPCGLHAFSTDGGNTFRAYLDFGSNINDYPSEWAYTADVEYTDGSKMTLDSCERPHLVMDSDGYTPLAITNGARPPNSNDYSFTLMRPINQKEN